MEILSFLPLKRDEFYTFLGGFLIAVIWSIPSGNKILGRWSDLDMKFILIFIAMWIFFVAVMSLFGSVLTILTHKRFEHIHKNTGIDWLYKVIDVPAGSKGLYYPKGQVDSSEINNHIFKVIFEISILSYPKILCLLDNHVYAVFIVTVIASVVSLYLMFYFHKLYYAVSMLNRIGVINYIDMKKVTELNSEHFCNMRFKVQKTPGSTAK